MQGRRGMSRRSARPKCPAEAPGARAQMDANAQRALEEFEPMESEQLVRVLWDGLLVPRPGLEPGTN
jgi:hypothetical protein